MRLIDRCLIYSFCLLRLLKFEGHLLKTELVDLREKKTTSGSLFRAVSTLANLLSQDLRRYQEETTQDPRPRY